MAIGKASDFQIYSPQFFGGLVETLSQATGALATVGINLTTREIPGDYERQSLISAISGIISRRDTTSVSAATDTAVAMAEDINVKLSRKIGPVAQTVDAWRKAGIPYVADWDSTGQQGLSRYLGEQTAKSVQIDMLNSGLLAARAFLESANSGSQTHTIGSNGTMTTAAMVAALAKMGDASDRVQAWLMHSKVYFDLLSYQTTVATGGTDLAFGTIASGMPLSLNRPIYVTDSPALLVAGTPDLYRTIGITAGGIQLVTSEQQTLVADIVTGLENLVGRMQGEFAYSLGIAGAKWDVTNGGANPNATAVGTGTNWDQWCTSLKDGPGVVIVSG